MNNDEEHIIIYKSPYYDKKRKQKHGKVIVFDLDETLGDFNDLELLWNGIQMYTHQMSDFELFKKLSSKSKISTEHNGCILSNLSLFHIHL